MEFRTTVKTTQSPAPISHSDRLMLLGSCFSDNIGARLRSAMMDAMVNPFGTIYNPLSLNQAIRRIITPQPIPGTEMTRSGDLWCHYMFHSRFSRTDKLRALEAMNASLERAHNHLAACSTLIITLGTALVYRLRDNSQVVSNCHKQPAHLFSRAIESAASVTDTLDDTLQRLHDYNPRLKVIFTVSPIRHIADSLETNSLSKATLRVAVADTIARHPQQASYFPAYEIMLDDLRDYRFYAADMVHPSDIAIEYIWQAFQATYFDDRTAQAAARCQRVFKRLGHRQLTDDRQAYDRFRDDTRAIIDSLAREYPHILNLKEVRDALATV